MSFTEYQTVRVRAVPANAENDDDALRPRVGDLGTVMQVTTGPDGEVQYFVEQNLIGFVGDRWMADFLAEDLEAVDAADEAAWRRQAESSATSLPTRESEYGASLTTRNNAQHDSSPNDSTVESAENRWSWQAVVFGLLALLVAGSYLAVGSYALFVAFAPTSWLGAAWRAALLMSVFIGLGNLLSGSKVGEALIGAFIGAITFFVLGGLAWSSVG
jgi:hypothetical protein|tara:strand:- start:1975 stop:2622 length:648 start_codon:yes stop_codon:yes gene_type:complete